MTTRRPSYLILAALLIGALIGTSIYPPATRAGPASDAVAALEARVDALAANDAIQDATIADLAARVTALEGAQPSATPVPTPTPTPAPAPDPTPTPSPSPVLDPLPIISAITVTDITPTSASVSWHVSEVAQGQTEYGPTTAYGSLTTLEASFTYQDHIQAISGLTAGTLYHFRVHAWDQGGQHVVSDDFTFTTAAAPAPAPTPTPTPPPPSPATGCTTTVASGGDIQAAIDAAPANATICLSGTYSASSELRPRSGQTIAGPATVNSVGYHRAFSLHQVTGVTLRDLTIIGSHPSPGTFTYGPEHAHGVGLNAASFILLERLRIERMQGDCVYVDHYGMTLSADVAITDLDCRENGRMGIAVVGGQRVTATNSSFFNIAWSPLNCEPEWVTPEAGTIQGCIDVRFLGGTVTGWVGAGPVTGGGEPFAYIGTPSQQGSIAPIVHDIEIADFTVAASAQLGMWVRVDPLGYRVGNVTVRNVTAAGSVSAPYIGSPALLVRVDGATITGNHQDVLYATTAFTTSTDSTGVSSSCNTGAGITDAQTC